MRTKTPQRRYVVRELPWLRGSRRRIIERCRYYFQAQRLAENLSREGRQVAIECEHVQVGVWLNGQRC